MALYYFGLNEIMNSLSVCHLVCQLKLMSVFYNLSMVYLSVYVLHRSCLFVLIYYNYNILFFLLLLFYYYYYYYYLRAGVLFSQHGDSWRELRRFTLQSLRDFGVGKNSLEETIMTETEALTTYFRKTNGEPISISRPLQKLVANVIYHIIFSFRYVI